MLGGVSHAIRCCLSSTTYIVTPVAATTQDNENATMEWKNFKKKRGKEAKEASYFVTFFAFPLFVPNSIGPEIHHFLLHSWTHIYGSVITRLKDL